MIGRKRITKMETKINRVLTRMVFILMLATIFGMAVPGNVSAATITVPDDYPTIQQAINAASPPDAVQVAAGTYATSTNGEVFPIVIKNGVSLEGVGASVTILDAEKTNRVIVCSYISGATEIKGFTIKNGSIGLYGAGIYCEGSSLTIADNIITENSVGWYYGGGIYCSGGSPKIVRNTITKNQAWMGGGGIACYYGCNATITDNIIRENSGGDGGGIRCYYSSPLIVNNTITRNHAYWNGGGILSYRNSNPTITNDIITKNSAGWGQGGILCWNASANIAYTNVWDNAHPDYFGCSPGIGCISEDPLYVDPANDDYHLQAASPCIDAGTNNAPGLPETDFDGNPRIANGIVDMGAYEYAAENTPPGENVVVSDAETGTTISFDTVDEGGETTVTLTSIGEGPPPPTGLKIVPLGIYYEINTTAEFSGTIQIAIEYDDTGLTEGQENALTLRYFEEATAEWVPITTGLDTENNIIYGETDHLSFFAVTYNLPPIADAGPDQTVELETCEGTEVILNGSGSSDPDGDPLTYEWTWAGGSASGVNPTVVLPLGTTTITLVVNDGTTDSDPDTVNITVEDTTPPEVEITFPTAGLALQDGVTLAAVAEDWSGVSDVYFYVREPDGGNGIPIGYEELSAAWNDTTELWELEFDTTELLDGYYVVLARAVDTQGNEGWSGIVPFSIRNWAVLELLPASESNKAGRTMPVKFSLMIAEVVDPDMPFIYNEELEVIIYDATDPGTILQTSLYGYTSKDYRIDSVDELYITNFKTKKQPAEYVVEIWRLSKDFLVERFTFETVK